jgi:hypothetical protein
MKTSSAKSKGRLLQKHVAKLLSEVFGWEDGDAESRPMGSAGIDIMMSPKARRDFPFSIECKNTKTFPSLGALRQSQDNNKPGTLSAVVWKPPRKNETESIIYFDLGEFVEFWKEHYAKD